MISPMVLLGLFAVAATPVLPAEPLLIGLGTLAAANHESPLLLIATGAVGCAVSDHLLYLFGRVSGTPLLARIGRRRSMAGLVGQFDRWGMAVLVAGRWVPGGGTVAALLAGATRRRLRWFTPASLLGSSIWATYATLLGYAGGALTQQPIVGAAVSLASAAILTCVIRLATARHARSVSEA
jgi:membrane protein DedA with SNARE-associated domain